MLKSENGPSPLPPLGRGNGVLCASGETGLHVALHYFRPVTMGDPTAQGQENLVAGPGGHWGGTGVLPH